MKLRALILLAFSFMVTLSFGASNSTATTENSNKNHPENLANPVDATYYVPYIYHTTDCNGNFIFSNVTGAPTNWYNELNTLYFTNTSETETANATLFFYDTNGNLMNNTANQNGIAVNNILPHAASVSYLSSYKTFTNWTSNNTPMEGSVVIKTPYKLNSGSNETILDAKVSNIWFKGNDLPGETYTGTHMSTYMLPAQYLKTDKLLTFSLYLQAFDDPKNNEKLDNAYEWLSYIALNNVTDERIKVTVKYYNQYDSNKAEYGNQDVIILQPHGSVFYSPGASGRGLHDYTTSGTRILYVAEAKAVKDDGSNNPTAAIVGYCVEMRRPTLSTYHSFGGNLSH